MTLKLRQEGRGFMRGRTALFVAALTLLLSVTAPLTAAHAAVTSSIGPVLQWNYDLGYGSSALDTSGHANTGTLGSGATWTTNAHSNGEAINFDGTSNGYVSSASTVVNTTQSFTVSAWVYLTSSAATYGIAAESGTTSSGFILKYDNTNNAWMFDMPQTDATNPTQDRAYVASNVSLNTWTNVVGMYDSVGHTIGISVNGVALATAAHTTTWNSTGSLQVGRLRWNGNNQNNWPGVIDDVQVYNRALPESEVADIYSGGPSGSPKVRWDLDEGSGTTTADQTGSNNNGTLGGTSAWSTTAHSGGESVLFDGTTTYISPTNGSSVVDSASSFSVSLWAYPTTTTGTHGVIAVGGTAASGSSGFFIKQDPTNLRWVFDMPQTDTSAPTEDQLATANSSLVANTWYHLVGTYNGATKVMAFYLNGSVVASMVHGGTPWTAGGALQVGRLRWNGSLADYFKGNIDDVRVYPRVLSATEVGYLYNDDTPGQTGFLYLNTTPLTLGATALTGVNTNRNLTPSSAWNVIDARGTGASWSATISSTALTSAPGTVETTLRTIAVGQLTWADGTVTAGSGSDPTTNITKTGLTLSGSAQAFISSSGTNRGTYSFSPTLTVAVPGNAFRSNYAGTVGSSSLNPYTATITLTIS
jgi:hypothetical protein